MTDAASARRERLLVALRVAVALAAMLTALVVGLAGLFASPASAHPFRQPETRVGAFRAAGGQVVGAHRPVLAGQRRARAPSYDQLTVGSCVSAETGLDIEGANFAQTTASNSFSAGGTCAGQTIDDVSGQLGSGALSPADVPIQVIERDGRTLILTTRSALALEQAGIPLYMDR